MYLLLFFDYVFIIEFSYVFIIFEFVFIILNSCSYLIYVFILFELCLLFLNSCIYSIHVLLFLNHVQCIQLREQIVV